jgi:hypothetical protein
MSLIVHNSPIPLLDTREHHGSDYACCQQKEDGSFRPATERLSAADQSGDAATKQSDGTNDRSNSHTHQTDYRKSHPGWRLISSSHHLVVHHVHSADRRDAHHQHCGERHQFANRDSSVWLSHVISLPTGEPMKRDIETAIASAIRYVDNQCDQAKGGQAEVAKLLKLWDGDRRPAAPHRGVGEPTRSTHPAERQLTVRA